MISVFKHVSRASLLVLLLGLYGGAHAETWYVTDKVLIGLYAEATSSSVLIKTLPTGTRLEVLEKGDDFWLVKEPGGGSGWMEASYLIERKPAQEVVLELSDKNKQTQADLKKARDKLGKAEKEIDQLQKDLKSQAQSQKSDDKQVNALSKDNEELTKKLADLEKKLAASEAELKKQTAALEQALAAPMPEDGPASAGANNTATDDAALGEARERIANLNKINQDLSEKINGVLLLLDGKAVAQPLEPVSLSDLRDATRWQGRDLLYLLGMLLLGLGGGYFLFDYINRRRHGGFRI